MFWENLNDFPDKNRLQLIGLEHLAPAGIHSGTNALYPPERIGPIVALGFIKAWFFIKNGEHIPA